MNDWTKVEGEYVNGEYRIVKRGIHPAYPWEVFYRSIVIEITRTLGEAKLAAETDRLERGAK